MRDVKRTLPRDGSSARRKQVRIGVRAPLAQRLRDGIAFATNQMAERPVRTLAISLGAGYLLGGGLASKLTARIIGAGLRIGLRMVSVPLLAQAAGAFLSGRAGGGESFSPFHNPSEKPNENQKAD